MAGAMQATKSAPMSILGSTMGATHTCFKDSKTGKFFPRQNRKRKLFSGQNFFLDPLAEQAERFDTGRRAGNEKKDAEDMLSGALASLEKLKPMCVAGEESYEERVAKREKDRHPT